MSARQSDRDWTDRVADVLGALGFNANRIRWKLHIWRNRRHKAREVGPASSTMTALLGLSIVIVYARLMVAANAGDALFNMGLGVVYDHGGMWPDAVRAGDWWRLGTAVFLHFGVVHLAFNLIALAIVGRAVEELYGSWLMLVLFMVTGLLASTGSMLWDLGGISAGASGAVLGLIGVAAAWGHLQQTSAGRAIRNQMLMWTFLTVVIGAAVGADNVAHIVGFVSGAVLGAVLPPRRLQGRRRKPARATLATIGTIAWLGCIVLALFPPSSTGANPYRPNLDRGNASADERPDDFDVTVSPEEVEEAERWMRKLVDRCAVLASRSPDYARQLFAHELGPTYSTPEESACMSLADLVSQCQEKPLLRDCRVLEPLRPALGP